MSKDTLRSRSPILELAPASIFVMAFYTIAILSSAAVAAPLAPLFYFLLSLPTMYSIGSIAFNQHRFSHELKNSMPNSWQLGHRFSRANVLFGSIGAAVGVATLVSAAITIPATGLLPVGFLLAGLCTLAVATTMVLIGNALNERLHAQAQTAYLDETPWLHQSYGYFNQTLPKAQTNITPSNHAYAQTSEFPIPRRPGSVPTGMTAHSFASPFADYQANAMSTYECESQWREYTKDRHLTSAVVPTASTINTHR